MANRHAWVHPGPHVYICRKCGLGKVNAQHTNGQWFVTWHLPTGERRIATMTPPCAAGPLTVKYLKKYEAAIACADHA